MMNNMVGAIDWNSITTDDKLTANRLVDSGLTGLSKREATAILKLGFDVAALSRIGVEDARSLLFDSAVSGCLNPYDLFGDETAARIEDGGL